MLMSVPFPPEEGIGNYVYNLSCKLVEYGHEVLILTRGGLKPSEFTFKGFPVFKLPFLMSYPFHTQIHGIFINKFLNEYYKKIDLIHVHMPLVPDITPHTIPVVTTFHTPLFADSRETELVDVRSFLARLLGILSYPVECSLINKSSIVTTVSKSAALDLNSCYGIKMDSISILGNAVNDSILHNNFDLSKKDDRLILYVGRIDYRKGVSDLVESMKFVSEKISTARLVIIGKGPLLPKLAKRISELNIQKNVVLRGFVSSQELREISLKASIFVIPSYYEGLPTTVLEAMANKLAVVATIVRGNVDVVREGKTGLLVPAKTPKSLASAILCLLEDSSLRQQLTVSARELIEEQYTWKKVFERTLAVYNKAIGAN